MKAFEEVIRDLLQENIYVEEFLNILKHLWIENNFMHRIAIYYK